MPLTINDIRKRNGRFVVSGRKRNLPNKGKLFPIFYCCVVDYFIIHNGHTYTLLVAHIAHAIKRNIQIYMFLFNGKLIWINM